MKMSNRGFRVMIVCDFRYGLTLYQCVPSLVHYLAMKHQQTGSENSSVEDQFHEDHRKARPLTAVVVKNIDDGKIHMLKANLSHEVVGAADSAGEGGREIVGVDGAGAATETQPPGARIDSNTSFQANKAPENNNLHTGTSCRSTNRKSDRHDAGRYDHMSDDASSVSSREDWTTPRRSRKMHLADSNGYDRGMSDCSHCRKHRMAKRRRSKRRKSRSRSRRRRR